MTKEKLIDKLYAEEKNIFTRNICEAYLGCIKICRYLVRTIK